MDNIIIKLFEKALQTILANPSFIPQICNFQKITPKEARQKKILKAYELREKKRRSKKITVGWTTVLLSMSIGCKEFSNDFVKILKEQIKIK